jgi:3'-phosphoadenosine 5'-phosphosulfate sulfotransferase (PAPS reductase)/FAD synthetase
MSIIHVVSVSGGKDSAATLLLAITRFGLHRVRGIFCDTGNEHDAVYAYLDYLEQATGVTIVRLKADFSAEIAAKRQFIARDQRVRRQYDTRPVFEADGITPVPKRDGCGVIVLDKKGKPVQKTVKIGGGHKVRWTNKAKRRALAVLYPTGNPYLDLCLWKGRFPSRKAQFCTEQLKRDPAVSYQIALMEQGHTVVSWQGVRRDESLNRRNARKFEAVGGGLYIFRPLVEWTAMDVFAYCASKGIEPNPLYKQGMGRVGCMPCINAAKDELKEIALRFPAHVDRIAEWEKLVGLASKRSASSFIPAPSRGKQVGDIKAYSESNNIYAVIEWSTTSRGGKQFSLLTALEEPTACASSYGLCE